MASLKKKECSDCGDFFLLTAEFWHRRKSSKDGFNRVCKLCKGIKNAKNYVKYKDKRSAYYVKNKDKISMQGKEWRANNKEKRAEYLVKYRAKNKEEIAKKRAKHYIKNKSKFAEYSARNKGRSTKWRADNRDEINKKAADYRAKNKDKISIQGKEYRLKNKDKIAELRSNNRDKQVEYWKNNKETLSIKKAKYNSAPVKYKSYADQLLGFEEIKMSRGLLEVKCAYCGKWFLPTASQVKIRIRSLSSNGGGRFYDSEGCKIACPIYHAISWPKGFKKTSSREANPLLRQLVLKRDDYTCQKCGATIEDGVQLHCHHVVPATQNPMTANDPDNCTCLCKSCHKAIHRKPGCGYHELREKQFECA